MTQSLTDRILAAQPDPKAAAVLKAGYETFLQFGLKRAAMQDIADRAGMSRAALYQHFRNKDDIYAAMMAGYFAAAAEAVEEALASDPDPARALSAAFEAQIGDAAEGLMRSAHAPELFSDTHAKAAAIMAEGTLTLAQIYARWIDQGVLAGRIAPDAVAGSSLRMAQVMLAGFDGLKGLSGDWPAYLDARRHLARIYARALAVS
ncbi:TetR/AcrR family transcriptional regulator [Jannaschia sp. CCS1]|uniref:TetR/AcrR family transcriptional regulator n=1 Tax=Jannaschia sp. (strain CCS1) TaxID=290400 RepID=UPI000053C4A4|nr:TetR/AcrR family transcriptional regulator [Jannaschia sp. CCS1]ABD56216.1 transcriptional regulator, TetR family [Jannaschia sp. CCS1]